MFRLVAVLVVAVASANAGVTYFLEDGEVFDQAKWDAMAAGANGLEGADRIAYFNTHQNLWQAEYSPQDRRLPTGFAPKRKPNIPVKPILQMYGVDQLPSEFDSRKEWPKCASVIGHIRNQLGCGDCWAQAAVGVMSDRTCIASGGNISINLSAEDPTACCPEDICDTPSAGGCGGLGAINDLTDPFVYWAKYGVVSEECWPFPHDDQSSSETDKCEAKCRDGEEYAKSKHFGVDNSTHFVVNTTEPKETWERMIRHEIFRNGPVATGIHFNPIEVLHNLTGVFIPDPEDNDQPQNHAVRIIGWGFEKVPYWLIANSWGETFLDQDYFRIIRGQNALGTEDYVTSAMAKLEKPN
jgi:cathepsin B